MRKVPSAKSQSGLSFTTANEQPQNFFEALQPFDLRLQSNLPVGTQPELFLRDDPVPEPKLQAPSATVDGQLENGRILRQRSDVRLQSPLAISTRSEIFPSVDACPELEREEFLAIADELLEDAPPGPIYTVERSGGVWSLVTDDSEPSPDHVESTKETIS